MSSPSLEVRARPKSVRRFNRNVIISLLGSSALFIFGAAAFALRAPDRGDANTPQELYNTVLKPMPDGLSDLPKSYADVSTKPGPILGPPLPGDLGAALIGSKRVEDSADNQFQYKPSRLSGSTPPRSRAPLHVSKEAELAQAVRNSKLFFIETSTITPRILNQNYSRNPITTDQVIPGFNDPMTLEYVDHDVGVAQPSDQSRKEAFLGNSVDVEIYNPHRIQEPISPYQVMAGTIIPASLITGLNSDLPGQVIAQVTENIYDTPTGNYLLIPQGSKLMGRYDSVISYGQSRALVAWSRLIMPDGSSITIENLPAVDMAGYAGLEDKVDYHSWRLFKAAILSSVLSIGAELGRDNDEDELLEALRDGGQRTFNQAGQQIVSKQIAVQPTVTIRPGWRLKVIVNKDLILKPYQG